MTRRLTSMLPIPALLAAALALAIVSAGCTSSTSNDPAKVADKPATDARLAADAQPATAFAVIHGAGDNKDKITGQVTFTQTDGGVRIVIDVTGLAPGKHGCHIHQSADLSSPDLKSAGPHFNPGGTKHGGPDSEMHHAGDLGNLVADDKGHATLDRVLSGLTIVGEKDGVVGHSVVIHAGEDDLKTDPAGNSGARIAAGAIEAGSAPKP